MGTWEGTIIPRGGKVRERVRRHWRSALYPTMLLVATFDSCVHKTLPLDTIVPTRLDPQDVKGTYLDAIVPTRLDP